VDNSTATGYPATPNGWRISRRTPETMDETGKDTLKNETANNKALDSVVGCMRWLGGD
jgi:hypothetical protein